MIVITDTGPLRYLILLEEAELLSSLYGTVVIPTVVHHELQQDATPEVVRRWMAQPPAWLSVEPLSASPIDLNLDRGETAVIQLALSLNAELVIMDDKKGRRAARENGLATLGTLGVLRDAAVRGLIAFLPTISRLQASGFYMSEELLIAIERDFAKQPPDHT